MNSLRQHRARTAPRGRAGLRRSMGTTSAIAEPMYLGSGGGAGGGGGQPGVLAPHPGHGNALHEAAAWVICLNFNNHHQLVTMTTILRPLPQ
jgi:hypothetical protein